MPVNPKVERVLARVEPGRRDAMRKILVTAAYTAPVVASFSMASLDAVAQSLCANQTSCAPQSVPAASPWSLAALAGVLGAAGAWLLRRRRER
jgi:MYXO-CTERM domain-containing protein